MKNLPALLLAAASLAACASRPDAIAPSAVPIGAYDSMSCENVVALRQTTADALAANTKAQGTAATVDAVGVFLVLVPVSSLTGGDREGLIAQQKGELIALDARLRDCNVRMVPAPAT